MKKNIFRKVAFHNYVQHPDEGACYGVIKCLYGEPKSILRISARDDAALQKAVKDGYTLVDVGGGQFDHHSIAARNNIYHNGVIKSAFGLVLERAVVDGKLSEFELSYVLQHGGYALQAADNGQDFEGVVSPFEYIHWLNASNVADDDKQMEQFLIAGEIAVNIFSSMLESAKKALPDHETFVNKASIMENHIVDLPHYMPTAVEEAQSWNETHKIKIYFFTFPGSDGNYRIQAVNKIASFALLKELPHKGLRNEDLNEAAAITDGVFVHPNGFIASARSLESCKAIGLQA